MLRLADKGQITSYLNERFGIPEDSLSDYNLFETGRSVWMVKKTVLDEVVLCSTSLKRIEFPGLRILRKVGRALKPTTYGLQIIGSRATRHIKELSREELAELLRKGYLEVENPQWQEGYIIALYEGQVLGCLLYREGRLKHQFPRGRAEALSRARLF
ncbi:MAG: hypothetical protein D6710_08450 [Nitrospirae bacterium]|nr:MAG: hypothetical protein D6710_08450 [Nitrospirota bacterium]